MWVGTRTGIGRFDGYELKKYLHDNITHLFEDNENKIWAVTAKGLYYYNESDDNFLQAKDKEQHPLSVPPLSVHGQKPILFGGYGKIYKYNYADRQTELLCSLQPDNHYNIATLRDRDKHTLLAMNRWKNPLLIDIRTGKTQPAPFKSDNGRTILHRL